MHEHDYPADALATKHAQSLRANSATLGSITQGAPLSVRVDAAVSTANETRAVLRELRGRLFGFRPEPGLSLGKQTEVATTVENSVAELASILSDCREFAAELNSRI